jgi:hypothetical protein
MLQDPTERMNRSMQRAATAKQSDDQRVNLKEAADQQQRTADALDRIADHFELLDAGGDVTETRKAMRRGEGELAISRPLNQQYDRVEQLASMAEKSQQDLLAELEAQLTTNPDMQDALSDISRDIVREAKNVLEESAERERQTRQAIERSDRTYQSKKRTLAQQIREIGQEARELSRTHVSLAESAAVRGQVEKATALASEVRHDLEDAADSTSRLRDDEPLDDVIDAAGQIADTLETAVNQLKQAKQLAGEAEDKEIYPTPEQRAAELQRTVQEQQRRHANQVRAAEQRLRGQQNQQRSSAQRVEAQQRNVGRAQKEMDNALKRLRRDPDNASAERLVKRSKDQVERFQRSLEQAQKQLEDIKPRVEQARAEAQALKSNKPQPPTAENFSAELAKRFADEGAREAEQLARRARQLAKKPDWSDDVRPSLQELTKAEAEQQVLQGDVSQAAEGVARAARHERRLSKQPLAAELAGAAEDIEEVAENEVADAETDLGAAARAETKRNESKGDDEGNGADDGQPSVAAQASLKQAQEAIAQQAQALDEILNPEIGQSSLASEAQDSAQAQDGDSSAPQRPDPAAAAEGRMLARTLDELDRAIAQAENSPEPSSSAPSTLSQLTQAAQAEAAHMAQGRVQSQLSSQDQASSQSVAAEQSSGVPADVVDTPDFVLPAVDRRGDEDWGQLRSQLAEDLAEGTRQQVSSEYRKRVETYFRVIAERARNKKQ